MCAQIFAAIVSDNDGSAFVTKKEFEALKEDFADQIAQYNISIDEKIDGAIASYLAGIKLNKKTTGINYFENMSDVRFYTISKDLTTSNIENDVYMSWLVRGFGSLGGWMCTEHNVVDKYVYGSWFYNSDGTHNRSGVFNTRGRAINYFYKVKEIKIDETTYKTLDINTSVSVRASIGAFASGYVANNRWGGSNVQFKPYDLDLSSWTTNELGPWTYSWSQNGMSMNANGIQFNVWNNSANSADTINNYYYFNNNILEEDRDINTFTESEFLEFADTVYTFDPGVRTGGDAWYVEHDGTTSAISEWTSRRTYVGKGYGAAPTYIVLQSWFTADQVTYDTSSGKIKYKRPNFKSIKSGSLVNNQATNALGKAVYPYNGAPLTTLDRGTVGIEAKISVTAKRNSDDVTQSGKPYYVLVSNKPFTNTDTSTLVASGNTDNIRIFHQTSGDSSYTISLDDEVLENWKENDVVYIRAMIEDISCYAVVDCSNVVLSIE